MKLDGSPPRRSAPPAAAASSEAIFQGTQMIQYEKGRYQIDEPAGREAIASLINQFLRSSVAIFVGTAEG